MKLLGTISSFLDTNAVKSKIKQNALTQGRVFLYFYLVIIYDAIVYMQGFLSIAGREPTHMDLATIYVNFFITVIGLIILFVSNGGANGTNFLTKYFAFSITVGFKYAILCFFLELLINNQAYGFFVVFILNIMMISNIAYRIYQTR